MTVRVLIAGVGNIFLGDDAFGVEVARQLAAKPLPEGVGAIDFGIRGHDLAYALMDGYDAAILVDAISGGKEPGTLSVIEPDVEHLQRSEAQTAMVETHNMDPVKVLRLVRAMDGRLPWFRLVGCEPARLGEFMELSAPVQAAVGRAIGLIDSLVAGFLDSEHVGVP